MGHSGYTGILEEKDVTFREFALRCARAFGPCVEQREEPMDKPPEVRSRLGQLEFLLYCTKDQLEKIRRKSDDHLQMEIDQKIEDAKRDNQKYQEQHARTLANIDRMIASVKMWTPPTSEHAELKEFMLQQLRSNRPTSGPYVTQIPTQTVAEYRQQLIQNCESAVTDATRRKEEREKYEVKAKAWIDALYASLPETP